MSHNPVINILRTTVGQRIARIHLICFVWEGQIDGLSQREGLLHDCGLLLTFVQGETLLLENSSPDGQTLRVKTDEWHGITLRNPRETTKASEPYGMCAAVDFSAEGPFSQFIGGAVREVQAIYTYGDIVGGARFLVDGRPLYFLVEGDEGHVSWAHDESWRLYAYRLVPI